MVSTAKSSSPSAGPFPKLQLLRQTGLAWPLLSYAVVGPLQAPSARVSSGLFHRTFPARLKLRRLSRRACNRRPFRRDAAETAAPHQEWPVSGKTNRPPWRVDRIARRHLPCTKRVLLLSFRIYVEDQRLKL